MPQHTFNSNVPVDKCMSTSPVQLEKDLEDSLRLIGHYIKEDTNHD